MCIDANIAGEVASNRLHSGNLMNSTVLAASGSPAASATPGNLRQMIPVRNRPETQATVSAGSVQCPLMERWHTSAEVAPSR
jgi:hypothetical protein